MPSIGQNIKLCRERQNLTKLELAQKLRVGAETIEKYESGEKTPNQDTILKLSTIMDVPVSELLH